MTLTTLQLSSTGKTVSFRKVGNGDPVVLLHGVGLHSAAWGPQIEFLKRTNTVIALDLPGHGQSSRLSAWPLLPDYVSWLQDVTDALALKRFALAGHSMGALIALGFAVTHPMYLDRVALVNGVFRRSAAARSAVIARAKEIAGGSVDVAAPLDRWFDPADAKVRATVAALLREVDQKGYAQAYAAFAQGDAVYADALDSIPCPFLAMTGDGDPNSTPEMARAMAEAVPGGRTAIVQGHRHMVNLTAPHLVNGHLTEWLSQPVRESVSP